MVFALSNSCPTFSGSFTGSITWRKYLLDASFLLHTVSFSFGDPSHFLLNIQNLSVESICGVLERGILAQKLLSLCRPSMPQLVQLCINRS
jgi:hypothetical protein